MGAGAPVAGRSDDFRPPDVLPTPPYLGANADHFPWEGGMGRLLNTAHSSAPPPMDAPDNPDTSDNLEAPDNPDAFGDLCKLFLKPFLGFMAAPNGGRRVVSRYATKHTHAPHTHLIRRFWPWRACVGSTGMKI